MDVTAQLRVVLVIICAAVMGAEQEMYNKLCFHWLILFCLFCFFQSFYTQLFIVNTPRYHTRKSWNNSKSSWFILLSFSFPSCSDINQYQQNEQSPLILTHWIHDVGKALVLSQLSPTYFKRLSTYMMECLRFFAITCQFSRKTKRWYM